MLASTKKSVGELICSSASAEIRACPTMCVPCMATHAPTLELKALIRVVWLGGRGAVHSLTDPKSAMYKQQEEQQRKEKSERKLQKAKRSQEQRSLAAALGVGDVVDDGPDQKRRKSYEA